MTVWPAGRPVPGTPTAARVSSSREGVNGTNREGVVVPTVQLRLAGVGSVLFEVSVARTWNLWKPLPSPL